MWLLHQTLLHGPLHVLQVSSLPVAALLSSLNAILMIMSTCLECLLNNTCHRHDTFEFVLVRLHLPPAGAADLNNVGSFSFWSAMRAELSILCLCMLSFPFSLLLFFVWLSHLTALACRGRAQLALRADCARTFRRRLPCCCSYAATWFVQPCVVCP